MIQKFDEFVNENKSINENWKTNILAALIGLGFLTTSCKKGEVAVYKYSNEIIDPKHVPKKDDVPHIVSDMWAFDEVLTPEQEDKVEDYSDIIHTKFERQPIKGNLEFYGFDDGYVPDKYDNIDFTDFDYEN